MGRHRFCNFYHSSSAEAVAKLSWTLLCSWQLLLFVATIFCLTDTFLSLGPSNSTLPMNQNVPNLCNISDTDTKDSFAITDFTAQLLFVAVFLLIAHCAVEFLKVNFKLVSIEESSISEDKCRRTLKVYNGIMYKEKDPEDDDDMGPILHLFFCQSLYLLIILLLNKESSSVLYKAISSPGDHKTAIADTNHVSSLKKYFPSTNFIQS